MTTHQEAPGGPQICPLYVTAQEAAVALREAQEALRAAQVACQEADRSAQAMNDDLAGRIWRKRVMLLGEFQALLRQEINRYR